MNPSLKRRLSLYLLSLLFIIAGVLHFLLTPFYVRIMPPYLPAHRMLVYISGVCEILGGVGVLLPFVRQFAGWGLIALLIAVFPANIQMFVDSLKNLSSSTSWLAVALLLLRLPLQYVLGIWVYRTAIRGFEKKEPATPKTN